MARLPWLALTALLAAAPAAAQASWSGEETWDLGEGWEASGSGTVEEVDPDSRSRDLSLGLTRTFEGGATTSLGTTLSEDPAAEVSVLGAELGAEAPLGPASLSLGLTASAHRAQVVQPERIIRRRRRTVVEPSVTERLRLWEFHPSATVSLPLFEGMVTPSFYAGRTFFSADPASVSERIWELESAPRAEEVAGHVDGLLSEDRELALDVELPAGLSARGAAGAERNAVDGSWSSSRSVELTLDLEPLELSAGWSRAQSYGERSDSWTGGLTWSFGGPPDDEEDEEDESEG
ncbi:hypothetical protein EPO15_03890 [bacterium]|nr:MAG: hypothetical protein EPO15_03890 [bacterium]